MCNDPESEIIESWKKNVNPWIRAVRNNEIEGRKLVTDKAIVDAVIGQSPRKVLDVGCGEGWLVRKLTESGIDALGIDVIAEFIESAKLEKKGRYRTLSYDQLSHKIFGEKFDAIVCNFSLFGKESVAGVFRSALDLLRPGGSFIIQTLHPICAWGEKDRSDGWVDGSWSGFSNEFRDPAPWYSRSIESWVGLFTASGFGSPIRIEPVNPKTGNPASVIFIGKCDANNSSQGDAEKHRG